jgi:hypothetical protein
LSFLPRRNSKILSKTIKKTAEMTKKAAGTPKILQKFGKMILEIKKSERKPKNGSVDILVE